MAPILRSALGVSGLLLAAASLSYLLVALRAVLRFRAGSVPSGGPTPPITILKPISGDEPGLYECLRSFCVQDYPEYQLILGVSDPEDAALPVLRRLQAEFPDKDIAVLIDSSRRGANPKVSSLINMDRAAKHPLVMVSDSDARAGSGCLRSLAAAAADPSVGVVTCLYKGAPEGSLASVLGALYINDWFIPSALVDAGLRGLDSCFGPATLVRREALKAIGGFSALADQLADDYMLGRMVKAAGYRVSLSDFPVETWVCEKDVLSLFPHELRWSRTVRASQPFDHLLSVVTQSLPLTALLLFWAPRAWALGLLGAMIALRLAINAAVRRRLASPAGTLPLVLVRDCLSFAVWAASFLGSGVRWRGRVFQVTARGTLAEPEAPRKLGSLVAGAAGLALTGVLVARAGPGAVADALSDAGGTGILAVTAFNLVPIILCSFAWRALMGREGSAALPLVLWARFLRSAISELLPISGELVGVRVLSLNGVPAAAAGASTVVDLTVELFAQIAFTLLGVLLLAQDGRAGHLVRWALGGLAVFIPAAAGFVVAQRRGMFRWLDALSRRLAQDLPESAGVHEEIQAVYSRRGGVLAAFLWHLAAWVIGVGEAWIALYFLEAPLSFTAVLIIESLAFALRSAAFVVPGALGVQEGGYIGLCSLFGLGPEIGLALSLLKRGREALMAAPALLAWQVLEGRELRRRETV